MDLVQIQNPRTGLWIKIDREFSILMERSDTSDPFPGIPIVADRHRDVEIGKWRPVDWHNPYLPETTRVSSMDTRELVEVFEEGATEMLKVREQMLIASKEELLKIMSRFWDVINTMGTGTI